MQVRLRALGALALVATVATGCAGGQGQQRAMHSAEPPRTPHTSVAGTPRPPTHTPRADVTASPDGTYRAACQPVGWSSYPQVHPVWYVSGVIDNTGNIGLVMDIDVSVLGKHVSTEHRRVAVGQHRHIDISIPSTLPQVERARLKLGSCKVSIGYSATFGAAVASPSIPPNSIDSQERHALTIAYGSRRRAKDLNTLYSICDDAQPSSVSYLHKAGTPSQLREARGAMLLCPRWPLRGLVTSYITTAHILNHLKSTGRVFYDGTYRVGAGIQPGTYYVLHVNDCYWERDDRNGNIIDNYFSGGAARVQVTILPSDYSFHSENCGEWRPVGY